MPLLINIRHVQDNDLQLEGELPVSDLDLQLEDELVRPADPLTYNVTVQKLEGQLLIRGRLELVLVCACARCLKSFEKRLEFRDWVCHLPLEGPEKVALNNDCVDLTPYIREDILLEFPQHPLCGNDCAGLPNRDHTAKGNQAGQVRSDWSELNKLKF